VTLKQAQALAADVKFCGLFRDVRLSVHEGSGFMGDPPGVQFRMPVPDRDTWIDDRADVPRAAGAGDA
jgi:hypothetical protein